MAVAQTHQPTAEWLAGFAERWLAAWNSHRPDQLLELMTDDVVYEDDAWPTVMHGHGDVKEFLEHAWTAMPDLEFRVIDGPYVKDGEPKAAFHWRGTGTMTGRLDPPGFAPTGKRVEFTGADFHEYRDGRVCRLRIIFDNTKVGQQLGLLPAAGSRAEQAVAGMQRLASRLPRP
jgi:steroid delta-isomerase-like uncharacterized protein